MSLVPNGPVPSAAFVGRCLDQLAKRGFSRVVTTALSVPEQAGFLGAGFDVEERLHLLVHDLRRLPPAVAAPLRRGSRKDSFGVLEVDHSAFRPFWCIDRAGLDDALAATPRSRFRVASMPEPRRAVTAYAITGRAGRHGFLQRLAVHPLHQRQGLGHALVLDALHWLRRWRVERAVVNTQLDNEAALALYESLGFLRESSCLSVLSKGLDR